MGVRWSIALAGAYVLVKSGSAFFRVVKDFPTLRFDTAYAAGFATGQVVAPMLLFALGIALVRVCMADVRRQRRSAETS